MSLTPEQIAERNTWQYRAVRLLRGNQTALGCLLLAVINQNAKHPPQFSPQGAVINKEGVFLVSVATREGPIYANIPLGPVSKIIDMWRGLAMEIRATDEEQIDMFNQLRLYVRLDERPSEAIKSRPLWT